MSGNPLAALGVRSAPDRRLTAGAFLFAPFAFALVFMIVIAARDWPLWQRSFSSDFSPVSWLSSVQLWAAGLIAVRLGLDRVVSWRASAFLALAMVYLALDEQFMFHEQWKFGCDAWTSLCRHDWVRELPMIAVGGVGLVSIVWLVRANARPLVRRLLVAAFAIGAFALLVDQVSLFSTIGRLEEAFEVLSEALFLGALLGMRKSDAPSSQLHSP